MPRYRYTLQPSDMVAALRATTRRTLLRPWLIGLLLAALALQGVLSAGDWRAMAGEAVVEAVVFVLVGVACLWLLPEWQGRRQFRRASLKDRQITLDWSETGLQLNSGEARSHLPWSDVRAVRSVAGVTLLELSNATHVVLPRSLLAAEDLAELRARVGKA